MKSEQAVLPNPCLEEEEEEEEEEEGMKTNHGKNYIMMNFTACILHLILLE
jgi:hypothetical protein